MKLQFVETVDSNFEIWLLEALGCAISDKSAAYCCGPITSGRLAFQWFQDRKMVCAFDDIPENLKSDFRQNVVDRNISNLQLVSDAARNRCAGIVIDPSRIPPITSWKQEQWRSFWCAVIERYVNKLVLVPGWEFSIGSVGEFAYAVSLGLPIESAEGHLITAKAGIEIVESAICEIESASVRDTASLSGLRIALRQCCLQLS